MEDTIYGIAQCLEGGRRPKGISYEVSEKSNWLGTLAGIIRMMIGINTGANSLRIADRKTFDAGHENSIEVLCENRTQKQVYQSFFLSNIYIFMLSLFMFATQQCFCATDNVRP